MSPRTNAGHRRKHWEPAHVVTVVMTHGTTCRVCSRVLEVGDHAYFMLYGVEHSCCSCQWWTVAELDKQKPWLAAFGLASQNEQRAEWLVANGYCERDKRGRMSWTALGEKRRDEWKRFRAASCAAPSVGAGARNPPSLPAFQPPEGVASDAVRKGGGA
jgi:hypothetical protein